ncbi:89baec30-7980-4b84-924c-cc1fdbf36485 [Thermothielavioides terrestris]|uniref:NTF2-like domain-containing protein n=2 Tax=Thermothielavioides terrestris TaxID=2587410 RepID=G2QVX6_THETT|nr:uncharacterized protein THITE_2111001 [Thermothielavioides terrestris NRRL 8126]AEO64708.1 hypothetical protein THITE_2111001 [Thermothielavioides terrestris NRRL 8126]SPQ26443.1 89baec30-7980-4b84-924c-cc1fdbf36485 [Thermothielavioides terrestris]
MRFVSSLALFSLAGLGLASPVADATALHARDDSPLLDTVAEPALLRRGGSDKGKSKSRHTETCLCQDDVDTLVDAYVRILSKWNETADAKYLADDFADYSDSINILAGLPLGGPTFPTKQAFIDHENTQPDNLPLKVTHKSPYDCNQIAVVWTATFGVAQKPVRGVSILGAARDSKKKGAPWQIKRIDVEFNSLAYLLDIGGSYTLPGQQQ